MFPTFEKKCKFKKLECWPCFKLNNSPHGGMSMVNWFNLGKRHRSKFANFLNDHELTQQDVANESKVSKSTISRLCQGDEFKPNMRSAGKIIKALRDLTKKNIDYDDFWSI